MATMLLSLTACSYLNPLNWFGDDEINAPTELVTIDTQVELNRKWSIKVGNGQGKTFSKLTPAVDGDVIYAVSEDGTVLAVDKNTGEQLWRTRLEQKITGGVGAGNGMVLLGTRNAEVIALTQDGGELIWSSQVSSEVLSAPQTNGDVIVAQTVDGKLVALNAEDGVQRWTYETNLPPLTLRGTSRPVITNDGIVIAGFSNGTLVAVAAEDGVWRWEERVAVPEGRYDIERVIDIDGDLLLTDSIVLVSSYQGNLMGFDVQTGRIVWGLEASSYHGLAEGFGNIYYSDDESHVVGVKNNSDEISWENENLAFRKVSAPTTISNYVAIADFEGYVHLLSQIDGRIIGRTRVDDKGINAKMLAHNNVLYVYGNSGRLTALTLQ